MPHVCLLYSPVDGQSWEKYFTKLLDKSILTHVSLSVKVDSVETEKTFSECSVVVVILTMNLVECLLEPNSSVSDKLNSHQSVAVIVWSSLAEEFGKVKDRFSNSSKWREIQCDGSSGQCQKVIADLAGLVDEQEKSRKKKRHKRKTLEIIPDRVHKSNEKIAIIFHDKPSGTVQIKLEGGEYIDCRRQNDQTYTFKAPLHDFGVTKITVYVDGSPVHHCPFTYQTPSLEAFRSISFLAQSLGLNKDNMQELDRKLVEIYEATLPADLTLHRAANVHMMSNKVKRSDYGIPTLLHFAAQYGLTDLCCSVLDTPGSLAAFHIENKDGLDPAQIADKEGFHELASFIRMFVETAAVIEVSDELYLHMTGEHLYNNRSELQEEHKETTEKLQKLHTSKPKKKLPPVPKKQSRPSLPKSISEPILEEPEEIKPETPKRKELPLPQSKSFVIREPTKKPEGPQFAKRNPSPSPPVVKRSFSSDSLRPERGQEPPSNRSMSPAELMGMSGSGLNIERSPGSLGSSSLDELIEIQKGVSEKEFSIDEAERLYSAWRERNRSFKMSMKDRQKGLEDMRNTYAGVIHQAKARGERQSLFERIKSTFGGRKSSREDIYQPKIKHTTYERVADWTQNRASTLSSGSSSSGSSRDSRMSISSQDSVYHSSDTDSDDSTSQRRGGTTGDDKGNLKYHHLEQRDQFYKRRLINKHLDVNRSRHYSLAKRLSYKDHYLQQPITEDHVGPPPVPPRSTRPK
ncbi:phosphoinositide 3-kinase adapter protein 1 isoform X3 [Magallana gigas]|uniref:phosphoinositide 3-kinase adapter protein 1 isoform X3 n=1 Tax=Magallana gigas TaxID=29159 RepID=UPI00333E53DC